jgi:biopolymer transport protein TolR
VAVALDSGGGGRKKGLTPIINVTPLVDVVLVLLIIFMVIIPNMQEGKTIEMVKVDAADKNADDVEPISITIDRNEICTYDDVDMSQADCLARLRAAFAENPRRRVLLRGDAALPYRVMREFFREAQEIGFGGVSLAVGVAREWKEGEG